MPYLKTDAYREPPATSPVFRYGVFLVAVLVLGLGVVGVWRVVTAATEERKKEPVEQNFSDNPGLVEPEVYDEEKIVAEVSKFILLPADEKPLIGKIAHAERLRTEQAFFATVEEGDILLVYGRSQRAVLYRPTTRVIVNTGPIYTEKNIKNSPLSLSDSTRTKILKLDIRNGSAINGKALAIAVQMKKKSDEYRVLSTTVASRRDFRDTIIFASSTVSQDQINSLVKNFGGKVEVVSKLPVGEKNTQSDVVIIIGNSL